MNLTYGYIFKLQQMGSGGEILLRLFQVLDEEQDLSAMTFGDKGKAWGMDASRKKKKSLL